MLLDGQIADVEFAVERDAGEGRETVIPPKRVEEVQHSDLNGWRHDDGGLWV